MSVIAISVEPDRLTRIFFDCSRTEPKPDDEVRIAREIARAYASDTMESVPPAA